MGIDIEKFKRHCNQGVNIVLENESGEKDTFKLKPLTVKQFVLFNTLAEKYNKGDIKEDDTDDMVGLFVDVIINSYPELDNELAENFALNNLADFMIVMEKLTPKVDEKKLKQIEKMKEMQQAGKNQDGIKPIKSNNSKNLNQEKQ